MKRNVCIIAIFFLSFFVSGTMVQAEELFITEAKEIITKGINDTYSVKADITFGEVINHTPYIAFLPVTIKIEQAGSESQKGMAIIYHNSEKTVLKEITDVSTLASLFPGSRDQLIAAGYF